VTSGKVEGGAEFIELAHALRDAGDKVLRLAVYKTLRETAKPIGAEVLRKGAEKMPQRGGLAARVAQGNVTAGSALTGKYPKVELRLRTRDSYSLRQLDRGVLRHPVFGNRQVWVRQSVPEHAFSDAFQEFAPELRRLALKNAEQVLQEIKHEVK
jgi:hypothetical protein